MVWENIGFDKSKYAAPSERDGWLLLIEPYGQSQTTVRAYRVLSDGNLWRRGSTFFRDERLANATGGKWKPSTEDIARQGYTLLCHRADGGNQLSFRINRRRVVAEESLGIDLDTGELLSLGEWFSQNSLTWASVESILTRWENCRLRRYCRRG